jgi:uncharacterized protein YegP (UPF0339 family)
MRRSTQATGGAVPTRRADVPRLSCSGSERPVKTALLRTKSGETDTQFAEQVSLQTVEVRSLSVLMLRPDVVGRNPRQGGHVPAKFVLTKERSGKFRFQLVATNGKPVATSELHGTKAGATRALEALRGNASGAAIDDRTAAAGASGRAAKTTASRGSAGTVKRSTAKKSAKTTTAKAVSGRSATKSTTKRTAAKKSSTPAATTRKTATRKTTAAAGSAGTTAKRSTGTRKSATKRASSSASSS